MERGLPSKLDPDPGVDPVEGDIVLFDPGFVEEIAGSAPGEHGGQTEAQVEVVRVGLVGFDVEHRTGRIVDEPGIDEA